MSVEYVHRPLNREVTAIGGSYVLVKELRLPFDGREVLVVIGHAAIDTSCCGVGGFAYALVPGFIHEWRCGTNEDGLPVSHVEPVRDEAAQQHIRRLLTRQEVIQQVSF